jgi:hypothetical protein
MLSVKLRKAMASYLWGRERGVDFESITLTSLYKPLSAVV